MSSDRYIGEPIDLPSLPSGVATDAEVSTAISNHAGQADPHTGYIRKALYTAANQVLISSGSGAVGAYDMNDATILAKPAGGSPAGPCDPPTVRGIIGIQNRLSLSNFSTCVGGSGGATTGTMACEIRTIDAGGADQCYVKLVASTTQYGGLGTPNGNVTLSAVSPGTVMASNASAGWWVIRTGALGNFGCTLNNAVDETVWFSVQSADCSSTGTGTIIIESVPASATWSA